MKSRFFSLFPPLGLFIWLLAVLFFLYEFFLRTFIGTLAHQLIPDLHLSIELFPLLATAYYATYGIMQIPAGLLIDKFGVKKIMVFATIVCGLATLMFAHATGFTQAFISRVFIGFGSSFAFICVLAVTLAWLPRRYFASIIGLSQFIGTLGPMLAAGPLILLYHHEDHNWRLTLTIIALVGFILALCTSLFVSGKRNIRAEHQKINYQLPLATRLKKLFTSRPAWVLGFYTGTIYCSIAFLGAVWGTTFLQAQGLSQQKAADIISVLWLGFAISCPLLGFISDLVNKRKIILISCAVIGFFASLCVVYLPSLRFWQYIILFFLLGTATSGQNISLACVSEQVEPEIRTAALGMNNGMISLFDTTIPLLAGILIGASAANHQTALIPRNFTLGFSILPLLYLSAGLIAIFAVKGR